MANNDKKAEQKAIAADEAAERGDVTSAQVLKEKGLLPYVLIRTYGAGVHIGYLSHVKDQTVELLDAKRLWRWAGANTLNEIALHGVDRTTNTRISEAVPSIQLLTAIEVVPVTEKSQKTLDPIWLD